MEKKHLMLIIALLLAGFATYIFYTKDKIAPTPTPIVKRDTVYIQKNASAETPNCVDYSNYQPSELTAGFIRDMVSMYKTNQLSAIQGSSTNAVAGDAQSIWFDIDTIKKFIFHIEKLSKQNGLNSKLGLRFYYAAYPNAADWGRAYYNGTLNAFATDPITAQYGGKHTLVILPTLSAGGNIQADFNPKDPTTYNGGYVNQKAINQEQAYRLATYQAVALTGTPDGDNIGGQNHGQLIPPASAGGNAF
jgi:hypothetical protein